MRQPSNGSAVRIEGQGRAYAAVIGATVGMLVAGLAIPLGFGHLPPTNAGTQSVVQLNPSFSSAPGANAAPTGQPLPSAGPSIGSTVPAPVIAAPGGGPSRPGAPVAQPTGGPSTGPEPLTASDVGVTATSVKIGVVLLDIQALQPLGFSQPHFTPQEQQQQAQVFIDQVNKSGGLAGRRLVPDWKTWNPVDTSGANSQGAICTQLGEDDKVFAAIGFTGANGANIAQCLTQQYGIPTIEHTGDIAEAYSKARGLLVTPWQGLERGSSNWGDLAVRSGLVNGRKIGTVSNSEPEETRPEAALNQVLTSEGATVVYRAHISNDIGTGQSQMPVEVSNMQRAGVNTVFLGTNFVQALQFVQTAEQQQFRPLYVVSDLGSLTASGLVGNMPPSFNGAIGFTQAATTDNAQDKACLAKANAALGTSYTPTDPGAVTIWCWMLPLMQDAANRAGARLTRQGLAVAFGQLGSTPRPWTLPGSFTPQKHDFADYLRITKYSSACKCYQAVSGPERGRY